jgi:hypothetical protein
MADLDVAVLSILASALLSGLVAVGISSWNHNRSERIREKFEIFKQLIGNRYHLQGDAFSEAINSVFVVFHDSNEVKRALMGFHEIAMRPNRTPQEANQKLLELFKAMAKNLGIATEPLTDNYFLEAYNIRP